MPFPFAPDQYEEQFQTKLQQLTDMLYPFEAPSVQGFRSPAKHYRMRAEFRVWHEGDRSFYAMYDPQQPKTPIEVTEFPVAHKKIQSLMNQVREAIHQDTELRHRLFQAEFLVTQADEALVTLIYHRPLGDEWEATARQWVEKWQCQLIGRSRKQRLVLDRDYVNETLTIAGESFHFRQYENSFTQPNASICEDMVNWACKQTKHSESQDLLELYCGNGNFSIPMAKNFNRALATEISRVSVNSAQFNIEKNNVLNLKIARMASEDLSASWIDGKTSRRFQEFEIDQYQFGTVLVDPPRAGLDSKTLELLSKFDRIVYISCNPETLVENLKALPDYKMTAAALFDQFPYTHHMEAGVVLQKL